MGREEIKKKKARRQNLESVEPEACHDGTQFAAFHERGESSKGNLAERRGNDPGNSNCCWEKRERKKKKKTSKSLVFPFFLLRRNEFRLIIRGIHTRRFHFERGERRGRENLQRLNFQSVWSRVQQSAIVRVMKPAKLDLTRTYLYRAYLINPRFSFSK